jgi:hypothetical protein
MEIFQQQDPAMQCPSDEATIMVYANPGGGDPGGDYKGNYGINWGSYKWQNQKAPTPNGFPNMPNVGGAGPFELDHTLETNRAVPLTIEPRHVTDGMSTTYFSLEMLTTPSPSEEELDRRARLWTPAASTHQISTLLVPNSRSCGGSGMMGNNPDDATGCGPDVGACINRPEMGIPCQPSTTGTAFTLGARSHHPGGVHVAMCDASARFMKEDVALIVWRSQASRAGEEAVSEN